MQNKLTERTMTMQTQRTENGITVELTDEEAAVLRRIMTLVQRNPEVTLTPNEKRLAEPLAKELWENRKQVAA